METFTLQDIIIQSASAGVACAAYSIICNAPRKELFYCSINGFLGWFIYMLIFAKSGHSVYATMIAAMLVTAVARFLSVQREAPSILYHIPGVLPLVPGATVYHAMQAAFSGEILATYSNALSGFKLAGAIGIGSLLMLVIPHKAFALIPPIKFIRRKRK